MRAATSSSNYWHDDAIAGHARRSWSAVRGPSPRNAGEVYYGQHFRVTPALHSLAAFGASLRADSLPPGIAEKARACVLYGAAVGIASCATAQPRIAAAAASAQGEATRFLDGARVAAGDAAFANGALFHARCQEDAHPTGHLGTVVLPTAFAEAETQDASGAELIAGIVAGYEIGLRIGRDHAADLSAPGFRTTSAYGVFAAAAASARLRRLDADTTHHALALAASMAGGLRAFVAAGSDEFPYQAGLAARNGLLASALAACGAEGPRDVLSGAAGFYGAFGGVPGRDYAARIADGLGTAYEMEQVAYKPYPTCQFHRGVVHALLRLRSEAAGAEAARIEIRMNPGEADFWGVRHTGPFTRFPQTFMSAPFCAAVAWTHGAVRLADMHDFNAPSTFALLQRVEVVADATRRRYCPAVVVTLADGRRLAADEDEGANAFTLDWAAAMRFTATLCTEAGVPAALQSELVGAAGSLATAPTVGKLVAAIRNAAAVAAHA
jgi:2-methylcitrate dehydratase PrpD